MDLTELNEPITLTFRIQSFEVDSFWMNALDKDDEGNYPVLEFTTTPNVSVKVKESLIICVLTIAIKNYDSKKKEQVGEIVTSTKFWVQDIPDYFVLDKKGFVSGLHLAVSAQVLSVSVSTTRGALVVLGKGTACEQRVYPLMDVRTFFKQPPSVK